MKFKYLFNLPLIIGVLLYTLYSFAASIAPVYYAEGLGLIALPAVIFLVIGVHRVFLPWALNPKKYTIFTFIVLFIFIQILNWIHWMGFK
ncbi:MAG: hypothetical protein JWL88_634 [Parcubacteria group bacterium]|nr:hypothetical protein [Parcubacteria group bacterium]